MRNLSCLASLVLALAACAQDNTARPGATPVDLSTASVKFFEDNPDAIAAALLNERGKGFEIYEDGKAYFIAFRAISDLRTRTGVSSMDGNQICFREQDGWGGACMELFLNPDGTYSAFGRFGNGATFRETFVLRPVFAS